jgi:hypothetical protein
MELVQDDVSKKFFITDFDKEEWDKNTPVIPDDYTVEVIPSVDPALLDLDREYIFDSRIRYDTYHPALGETIVYQTPYTVLVLLPKVDPQKS